MRIRLEFEPRDLWLGIYWKRDIVREPISIQSGSLYYMTQGAPRVSTHVYLCLVPMVPLHISWTEDRRL